MMYTVVAVSSVGIIRTPNQPMYRRFSVLVIHEQKRSQTLALARLSKVAVIFRFFVKVIVIYFPSIYCTCWIYYEIKKYYFKII
jgi:hypothetical protein